MSKVKVTKKEEDWIQKKWRPMMAVMYMMVCIFDFILFPIMFTIVQFWETQAANDAFRQWQPLTLLGGGLFHVAMGAVLGVTAWSRGQEKIAGASLNVPNQSPSMPTTLGVSSPGGFGTVGNNSFATSGYAQPSYSNYESTRETFTATPVVTGYKGKKAPPQEPDPVI
jgi:hypothetical protein